MAATKSWQLKPVLPQANLVTNIPTQESKLAQTAYQATYNLQQLKAIEDPFLLE